jgi:hypothetical protein
VRRDEVPESYPHIAAGGAADANLASSPREGGADLSLFAAWSMIPRDSAFSASTRNALNRSPAERQRNAHSNLWLRKRRSSPPGRAALRQNFAMVNLHVGNRFSGSEEGCAQFIEQVSLP